MNTSASNLKIKEVY